MITIACSHRAQLGEGPVWDEQTGRIYWIDILSGTIHQLHTSTSSHHIHPFNQLIGSIALCNDGSLLVAAQQGPAIFNPQDKTFVQYPFFETGAINNRFNDGKCDADGRFWVGTMSMNETAGAGSLYTMNAYFQFKDQLKNLTIPNGMAWSNDGNCFYFIDTLSCCVMAYNYDAATARLSNGRAVIKISPSEGAPDGMTIDEEGMLWIAHWDGWQVTRWDPGTGKQLFSLKLPVARVTSCVFGGKDLSDLYITTAFDRLTKEELSAQPLAGSLFVWKNCGFKGRNPDRFKR